MRLDDQIEALVRAADLDNVTQLLGVLAGALLDLFDEGVVVGGIVVGEHELAHPRGRRELHGVFVGAVAPILPGGILLRRVLRVVDHQPGAFQEPRVAPVALVHDGLGAVGRGGSCQSASEKGSWSHEYTTAAPSASMR